MACLYKNIFGEPNTGVHSYRLAGFAIADILLTIVAALIVSWTMKSNFLLTLAIFFLTGIIFHRIFCVSTALDIMLFA
jgi:hypothetical protein